MIRGRTMNNEIALTFIESLVERIERDQATGKLKIEGIISEKERLALGVAIKVLGGSFEISPHSVTTDTSVVVDNQNSVVIPLNLDVLSLEEAEDPDVILCLDFGTAMSKAFATNELDEVLVDLEIGLEAGQVDPIYALVSSIFITNSGRILFGHQAINESTHAVSGNRRRFDSIKDILCKDVVCDLDEAPLESTYNPTEVSLTKGDMVTLYLGYFTDMAVSQLSKKDFSRYVNRRFTLPVLPHDRAPWAEDQLRKLLARAQILADTLHGKWQEGIDVATAKQVLNDIKNLEEIPSFLIDVGIVEPVAAVGSRFRNAVSKNSLRRLLMVVDVGAGTIDYALFAEIHNDDEALHVYEIPGSVQVLRQAGDTVDKLLRRFILKQADVTSADSDFHMIDADLTLRIRQIKEQLFRDEKVNFTLSNDKAGEITLSDFLDQPGVREFEKSIHGKFFECLNNIDDSWISHLGVGGLAVVFTGGGAGLPIVQSLAASSVIVHGQSLMMRPSTLIPPWVKDDYPELESEFSQLAVAIGGASRDLPILAAQTFGQFGGIEADGWTIKPALKGS